MRAGCWVFVVGPSGAGKDSVIAWAREHLAGDGRVVFARRLVTRVAGPGSDHDEIGRARFGALLREGGLAWHWQAHGFGYGIAASYAAQVAQGRVVVVNGSREHAAAIPRDAQIRCVLVSATPSVLQQRLQLRAREDQDGVAARMARTAQLPAPVADLRVHNEGALEAAGLQLARYLQDLASR